MANTGFQGLSQLQTGTALIIRTQICDSAGVVVTTGATTCEIGEWQSDGTLKTYDFTAKTFTAATVAGTVSQTMTHRPLNGGAISRGLWSLAIPDVAGAAGFTVGAVYIVTVNNASASIPPYEFQYGSGEGDAFPGQFPKAVAGSDGGLAIVDPTSHRVNANVVAVAGNTPQTLTLPLSSELVTGGAAWTTLRALASESHGTSSRSGTLGSIITMNDPGTTTPRLVTTVNPTTGERLTTTVIP